MYFVLFQYPGPVYHVCCDCDISSLLQHLHISSRSRQHPHQQVQGRHQCYLCLLCLVCRITCLVYGKLASALPLSTLPCV